MLTVDPIKNFAKGTLLQGYTSLDTIVSFIPNDGAKFPNPNTEGAYNVVWWNDTDYADPADDPEVEIVRVVSGTGDVKTIVRAQEGTLATNKNVPNKTYKMVLAFTQKMLDDIVNQAGTGTVQTASSLGGGVPVYNSANSTAQNLVFNTLVAGANVTITPNVNGTITISASGGGGGSGYNTIENNGTPVAQQTTINLSTLLTATDSGGKTALTINVTNLANDTTFVNALIANTTFTTNLANNSNFYTTLANNTNFINALTSNSTFQTNVNNFVSGGSGGSGGTKLAIDTTQVTVAGTNVLTDIIVPINIPGGTLGTNNAIRFKVIVDNYNSGATSDDFMYIVVKYGGTNMTTFQVLPPTGAIGPLSGTIEGYIIADGTTGDQKAYAQFYVTSSDSEQDTAATVLISKAQGSDYGTGSVDSTVDQNLQVMAQWGTSPSVSTEITTEAVIVEKISGSSSGGNTIQALAGVDFAGGSTPLPVSMGDGNSYYFYQAPSGTSFPGFTTNVGDVSARTRFTQTFEVREGNVIQIDAVRIWVDQVVGTPAGALSVSIQGTTGGNPDGTPIATGTNVGYGGSPAYQTSTFSSPVTLSAPQGGGDVTYAVVIQSSVALDPSNYYIIGTANLGGTNSAPYSYNGTTWATSNQQPAVHLGMTYADDSAYISGQTPVGSNPRMQSIILNSGSGNPYVETVPTVLQRVAGYMNESISEGGTVTVSVSGAMPGFSGLNTQALYYVQRSDGSLGTSTSTSNTPAGRSIKTDTMLILPS